MNFAIGGKLGDALYAMPALWYFYRPYDQGHVVALLTAGCEEPLAPGQAEEVGGLMRHASCVAAAYPCEGVPEGYIDLSGFRAAGMALLTAQHLSVSLWRWAMKQAGQTVGAEEWRRFRQMMNWQWLDNPWRRLDREVHREAQGAIIISRSMRYPGDHFPWSYVEAYKHRVRFVGSEEEFRYFKRQFGPVAAYLPTPTLASLWKEIGQCALFVGNQSLAFAMAEGMKVPRVLEECPVAPNCHPWGADGHTSLQPDVFARYIL